MPGQYHLSIDQLPAEVDELSALGVPAVLLFGLPGAKDACGTENYRPERDRPAGHPRHQGRESADWR